MANNRIRNIMEEQGITTAVLAKKIGMTPSGLNQHISGNPSVKTGISLIYVEAKQVFRL